jgi:hypothetical protein
VIFKDCGIIETLDKTGIRLGKDIIYWHSFYYKNKEQRSSFKNKTKKKKQQKFQNQSNNQRELNISIKNSFNHQNGNQHSLWNLPTETTPDWNTQYANHLQQFNF